MRPLVFRPNEKEFIYIEDNGINWSEYCHHNLDKDMNNQKYVNLDKFQMPFMLILIGLLLLLIAVSNMFTIYIVIAGYTLSLFSLSFGIFSMIGGLKRGR